MQGSLKLCNVIYEQLSSECITSISMLNTAQEKMAIVEVYKLCVTPIANETYNENIKKLHNRSYELVTNR